MNDLKWNFVYSLRDEKVISEVESKFKIKMPTELYNLIKNYNGGCPNKNVCKVDKLGYTDVNCLLSYESGDESIYDVLDFFLEKFNGLAIPFACDSGSGYYLYTSSGVYYTNNDNIDELFFVAKDIPSFLENLTEE